MICDDSKNGYANITYEDYAHYTAADGTHIRCQTPILGRDNEEALTETKWTDAVDGAKTFVDQLMTKDNTYVSLVTFASSANNATDFRDKASALYEKSDFGHPYGGTDLEGAITEAQEKLATIENENAQKYILVISDGEPDYI
ncbi:MAG: VWA domain-containing protein, partial [Clostridia bacterium]|nr:VWA domain-containing protein [Clostridia bacterium]